MKNSDRRVFHSGRQGQYGGNWYVMEDHDGTWMVFGWGLRKKTFPPDELAAARKLADEMSERPGI